MTTGISAERRKLRQKRKIRVRKKLATAKHPQVVVFRSKKHTYAQVLDAKAGKMLFSVSTQHKNVQDRVSSVDKEGIASDATSGKSVVAAKAACISHLNISTIEYTSKCNSIVSTLSHLQFGCCCMSVM